ncbi:MAG: hypothetical protein C6Y20_17145 [Tagaea sp. CACIAM 22H2]|nr:hypothetical protein [Tagaea sp. CACIAM 22H2]
MFTLTVAIAPSDLAQIKADLTRSLPNVKSSHRCEGLARGLGFGTYASLLEAVRRTVKVSVTANGQSFCAYLAEHDFNVKPQPFYFAVARIAIKAALEREPMLTRAGIGIGGRKFIGYGKRETWQEYNARVEEWRAELFNDRAIEEFLGALAFLARVTKTRTIRPDTNSYRLKHFAEEYSCSYPEGDFLGPRYIPNGSFIAAAICAGFEHKTYAEANGTYSLNVNFNMSKSSLNELECEVRPNGTLSQERRRREEARAMRNWLQDAVKRASTSIGR